MSVVGLTIQCVGILLVTVLSLLMTRSIKRPSLNYWTTAWVCLSAALVALSVAFQFHPLESWFYFIYYLGEYGFGYFFYLGCRHYTSGRQIERRDTYVLGGLVIFAIGLAFTPTQPGVRFIPHFVLLATLLLVALRALVPALRKRRQDLGLRVMTVALLLLSLNFFLYVPTFAFVVTGVFPVFGNYLGYSSIYDMVLETLLGFGTVMLVMEDMRIEVEGVNHELVATKEKLEAMAKLDPLTEALNRHAFYSLVEPPPAGASSDLRGCTVVIDIDNLKPINDRFGHAAGDTAIREVARRLRAIIRADDMLFRWGGDEFLILLFGADEAAVRNRLDRLASEPSSLSLPSATVPLVFSYGVAEFSSLRDIEQAIDRADAAMYESKLRHKAPPA